MPVRSQRPARARARSRCPSTPTRSGTATCPRPVPACCTAIGSTVPTSRARPSLQSRTSCCSIPTPRCCSGALRWTDAHFGYRLGSPREDLSFDRRDNARGMPKCARHRRRPSPGATIGRPGMPWGETIIYETHVRGMTMRHPAIAGAPARHLRRARPPGGDRSPGRARHHRDRAAADARLHRRPAPARQRACATTGATTTIGFFAPEPRYLAGRRGRRVQDHGQALPQRRHRGHPRRGLQPHRRGQPPRADAVASRASTTPPTTASCPTTRASTSTTPAAGNTINLSHPRVLQMVTDSLRYWVEEMHVDGFRFDLAATLGRELHGFDPDGGFFDAIRQDRVLARRQADRRALGHRSRRLSGRQLSARLVRAQRPLPRRRAPVTGRATRACCRSSPPG